MTDAIALADRLNRECECVGTDLPALQQRLDVVETHPHLFADVPVFVAKQHAREMQRVIRVSGGWETRAEDWKSLATAFAEVSGEF